MRRTTVVLAAAALIGLACGAGPDDDNGSRWVDPPAAEQAEQTTAPKAKAPKVKAPRSWGDGDWEVGKDIPPGQYKTTAGTDVFACTWQRVKDFSGGVGSHLVVGVVEQSSTGRMVVKKTDYGVSFSGGCKWTAVK